MRGLIQTSLLAQEPLANLVGDRIYGVGALGLGDVPAEPQTPYVQWGEESASPYSEVRETSSVKARVFRFYVYDDKGSYTVIDDIHELLRQTLEGLVGVVSPSGRRCTGVGTYTLGGDLVDETRRLAVKSATCRLTAR